MKKFYRYMSGRELLKLLRKEFIEDRGTWKHSDTCSRGVCFVKEDCSYSEDYNYNCIDFYKVSDILNVSYFESVFLVEFDASVELIDSVGCYPTPIKEFYIKNGYSLSEMTPTRVAVRIDKQIEDANKENISIEDISWEDIDLENSESIISSIETITDDYEETDMEKYREEDWSKGIKEFDKLAGISLFS